MSLTLKRLFMALFGLLGAAALWPVLLGLRALQAHFPSFLAYSFAQGACLGAVFGAFFGSFEGVIVSSRSKAFGGFGFGAAAGAGAGALGVLAGQLFLFSAGSALWKSASQRNSLGLAVASGIAWAIAGLCIALIEGLRARSSRKMVVGLAGGLAGGITGGAALSALSYAFPESDLSLLAGLAVFGLCLSAAYSLFENRFSAGSIMLLNGPLKGKEYYVLGKALRIGSSPDCDIVLKGYPDVEPLHVTLRQAEGKLVLNPEKAGARLLLNDEPPAGRSIRPEDVITVGKAKLMYGYFS